jgi:KDO2-lipid IV(A) lauroyltransferase
MIKLISRVPLWVLYGLAWIVYVLSFYVLRHRRHVIVPQLELVFPSLSEAERRRIHKQFLKNYCQVMVEILKGASISAEELKKRVRITDLEPVLRFLDAGRSVMFLTSHMGNWEWLLHGVTLHLGYPLDAAYKPIRREYGERLLLALRTRLPIFYVRMRRVRRGRYEVEMSELWDGSERTESGELTARYARACEADVLARPADWLWTYRRWRFKKPLYGGG